MRIHKDLQWSMNIYNVSLVSPKVPTWAVSGCPPFTRQLPPDLPGHGLRWIPLEIPLGIPLARQIPDSKSGRKRWHYSLACHSHPCFWQFPHARSAWHNAQNSVIILWFMNMSYVCNVMNIVEDRIGYAAHMLCLPVQTGQQLIKSSNQWKTYEVARVLSEQTLEARHCPFPKSPRAVFSGILAACKSRMSTSTANLWEHQWWVVFSTERTTDGKMASSNDTRLRHWPRHPKLLCKVCLRIALQARRA